MALYARSDIQGVALSGVGHTHKRPMRRDGTPVRTWELNCEDCEIHLDDDQLWSKSKYKIPLTDEEREELDDLEKQANAALERERIAAAREIASGLRNKRNDEGDGDKDDDDDEPVNPDDDRAKQDPEPDPDPPTPPAVRVDYDKMQYNDLMRLCRELHLDTSGKKADLVKRLEEHDDQPVE